MKTITKSEIDRLYKKVGLRDFDNPASTQLNKGTMHNKLSYKFRGARSATSMKGSLLK